MYVPLPRFIMSTVPSLRSTNFHWLFARLLASLPVAVSPSPLDVRYLLPRLGVYSLYQYSFSPLLSFGLLMPLSAFVAASVICADIALYSSSLASPASMSYALSTSDLSSLRASAAYSPVPSPSFNLPAMAKALPTVLRSSK